MSEHHNRMPLTVRLGGDMQQHDDMDFFERTHYRLNKRLLFYLGQWPLQTPSERNFYGTTTVLFIGSLLVPEVIKFIECLGDLNGMIECLPVMGIHFRSAVMLINSNVNVTKMRKLTVRIKDDWTVRANDFDEAVLKPYADRGRLLTVGYTVYMLSALAMYLSLPLIPLILDVVDPLNQSRHRIYLFQTEYFVDQEEKYFYIMFHAYLTMPIALGIIIANDTMNAVYVQHACSIFATLGARLQRVGGIASNTKQVMYKNPAKRADEAYDDIVACIKMHNEAVEIAKLIESSSCICHLFVVGASILTITVSGFVTVTNLHQPSEALRFGVCVVGDLIHLYFKCWQGNALMEHSEDIFVNAYNVDWYEISPRAKRLLLLIMLRSLEPCRLTAGKVFVLSMETYAAALKTSMSYFTFLFQRPSNEQRVN